MAIHDAWDAGAVSRPDEVNRRAVFATVIVRAHTRASFVRRGGVRPTMALIGPCVLKRRVIACDNARESRGSKFKPSGFVATGAKKHARAEGRDGVASLRWEITVTEITVKRLTQRPVAVCFLGHAPKR